MSRPTLNLQDNFLNQVRRENLDIVLILLDGSQLIGRVKGFDNFTVIVSGNAGGEHLVYKHAIAQLVANKPIVSTVAMQRPPRQGSGEHSGPPRREGGGGPRPPGGGQGGSGHGGGQSGTGGGQGSGGQQQHRGPGGPQSGGEGSAGSGGEAPPASDEGEPAAPRSEPLERPQHEARSGQGGGGGGEGHGGQQKPKGRQGEGFNKLDLSALRDKV